VRSLQYGMPIRQCTVYLLVKWCHPVSILPDIGATWVVLEPSIVPEPILRSPYISNFLIINSEDYVIVGPFQSKQMIVVSKTPTSVLNIPEKGSNF
jgi:hypothetical protein